MANEKKGGTGIRYDDFVKIVKPNPGATEQVVLLHGYVGASVTDDKIRLYSDASLAEYADIAKADIVYSLPNDDDPLGGSRLWVKQSASVNYADAQGYAQGDMYNSYMNDQYAPGTEAMGAGAATLACTIAPLTRTPVCRPTRFICPTPVSRLVICTVTRPTQFNCPPPITLGGCPQPSWVDACPSQWGCTIQTGTTVINPGGGAQFNDYTGGDVYNDYMQNSYEGGGYEGYGPQPTTTVQTVQPTVITTTIRPTSPVICRITVPAWRCFRITRNSPWCPPVTCQLGTIRPTTWPSLACNSIACATDFTRVQTGTTVINPGAGVQMNDYTGGDVYNDYMQNSYEGVTEAFGPGAATSPQVCLQPVSVNFNCVSRLVNCVSRLTVCISQPAWRCITRQQQRSLCRPCITVTGTRTITTTFPSAVDGCPSQFGCATDITRTINPDTINPGGFYDYGY